MTSTTNERANQILVIDDEKTVLMIARAILEGEGFDVLTSKSGEEGLELFQQNASRISTVILDLTMPGLSGAEVYQRLRALKPELKILLSSGYSDGETDEYISADAHASFLPKPYRAFELKNAVNALTGSQPS